MSEPRAIALNVVGYAIRLHNPNGPWNGDVRAEGVVVVATSLVAYPASLIESTDISVGANALVDVGGGVGILVKETPQQIANLLDARTIGAE